MGNALPNYTFQEYPYDPMTTPLKKKAECYKAYNLVNPVLIDWDFYYPYTQTEPPFGQLGLPVFLRTYSRHIKEINRREKWCEVCLRVVEYSLSLDKSISQEAKVKEAKELFDALFNFRGFAAGRSYWVAGTAQTKVDGSSNWNCVFRRIDSITAYSEIFYWLLIGAGTGFSVEAKNVSQLPRFYPEVKVRHEEYEFSGDRNPFTVVYEDYANWLLDKSDLQVSEADYKERYQPSGQVLIVVGDSKEGWCNALRMYLHCLTQPDVTEIIFDYNSVRPKGERIKTFGGKSSGYGNLKDIFQRIHQTLIDCQGRVNSVAALDIANIIGKGVVSGGVRRTAEIALGDADDIAYIEAKYDLWSDPAKARYRETRVMSNNSVLLYERPSLKEWQALFERIKSNGEPGIYAIANARKHDPEIEGTNPCGEAGLRNLQSCNLTTLNVAAHVYYDAFQGGYRLDGRTWASTVRLITRIGVRQTLVTQWHPDWDAGQKSQRLLGVSMTGIMDAVERLGWDSDALKEFFSKTADLVRKEADLYHDELGINRSARVTLVKPEGTLSQLPTVSSGIHRAYSPYYFRRIRFSKSDPVAQALYEKGLPTVPENGQGADLFDAGCDTWVITLPVKTGASMRAIDESAIEQLERYKLVQNNYVRDGHNCSVTVTLAPDEYELATQWMYDNWDSTIGVSFLPRFDPREGGKAAYPNMPYEPCTQEEYEELVAKLPQFNEDEFLQLLRQYEREQDEYVLDNDCSSGSCPVR